MVRIIPLTSIALILVPSAKYIVLFCPTAIPARVILQ